MNILISINIDRQFRNILNTPLFNLILNDKKNNYIILSPPKYIHKISHLRSSHIHIQTYYKSFIFKKLIFSYILQRYYEMKSLFNHSCKDTNIFLNRLKNYKKKRYLYYIFIYFIIKLLPSFLLKRIEDFTFYNKKYLSLEIDKILITDYLSFQEKQIFYTYKNVPLYLYTDGWDMFTKWCYFPVLPQKVYVWDNMMTISAKKNCNIPKTDMFITGNLFWSTLPDIHINNKTKKLMIFSSNKNDINQSNIIKRLAQKNNKETIHISCRFFEANNPFNQNLKNELKKIKNIKLFLTDENTFFEEQDEQNSNSYRSQLINHDFFIFFGPTTAILDCLYLEKPCIICVIKSDDKTKWDWTETLHREVLDEIKTNPLVHICDSFVSLTQTINTISKQLENNLIPKPDKAFLSCHPNTIFDHLSSS